MDIIILAALAVYIFIKLRSELGNVNEDQKREAIKKFIKQQIKTSKNTKEYLNKAEVINISVAKDDGFDEIDESLKDRVKEILNKTQLSLNQFMNGASSAFEIIIESFSKSDLNSLKPLLNDKIFYKFEQLIKQNQEEGKSMVTQIVSIDKKEIVEADIIDDHAVIKVKFTSQQINYSSDSKGNLLSGSKQEISSAVNIWTFKKDLNSKNPNWLLSAT